MEWIITNKGSPWIVAILMALFLILEFYISSVKSKTIKKLESKLNLLKHKK